MTTSFTTNFRKSKIEDIPLILDLYKKVSAVEGRLARTFDEISDIYITNFTKNALENGVQWLAEDRATDEIIGEIHCYPPIPKCFSHVLSELTIAVHPKFQGQGIGRCLFDKLIEQVQYERPEIIRIELIVRDSNQQAIHFYQTLGFEKEGELRSRIKATDGTLEADIPMAWLRE